MRRKALDYVCASCRHCSQPRSVRSTTSRRNVHISATPSSSEPEQNLTASNGSASGTPGADARFEVLGNAFSLLSASISPSQNLYTRKGSLVGFNGKAENAVSTLSLLSPFRRALTGIPFLYQRITSTSPYTALISTKSHMTSLVVVHLDGRLDWMVAQRKALLAWTGATLSLSPRLDAKMSLAHWGNTHITGRGLLSLSGKGLIHQIHLKADEEYVVHPSHVIAYAMMQHPPQPYRFKANLLRFQIPNPVSLLPDTRFWRSMRQTSVWIFVRDTAFLIRTWSRRIIWGDRLFLHFRGPAQILIQSRGSVLSDVLTTRDVNEIADAPAGAVPSALTIQPSAEPAITSHSTTAAPKSVSYATVNRDGTVKFNKS